MQATRLATGFVFVVASLLMVAYCSNFGRDVNKAERSMIFEKLEVGLDRSNIDK